MREISLSGSENLCATGIGQRRGGGADGDHDTVPELRHPDATILGDRLAQDRDVSSALFASGHGRRDERRRRHRVREKDREPPPVWLETPG